MLTVMAIYPVLLTFLTPHYTGNTESINRLLILCALLISFIDLLYIALELLSPGNALTAFIKSIYADDAVVDNAVDYLKFTLPNVATCIFLLPFIACQLLYRRASPTLLIAFAGLVAVALLSGRRAILVTSLFAPLLAYILTTGSGRNTRTNPLTVFALVVLIATSGLIFFGLWPEYVTATISSIFDFTANESNIERKLQFQALWSGFQAAPLFGAGAGAVADYIRSDEMPWAYELFYVSILFQYGIAGSSFYIAGISFIVFFLVKQVRKKGRSSFEFFYLSGFLAFIAASATNPYIAKFDYMWTIFIPVALMNNLLLKRAAGLSKQDKYD